MVYCVECVIEFSAFHRYNKLLKNRLPYSITVY